VDVWAACLEVGVTNIETKGKAGIGVYSTALSTGLTTI
jgi:hypothetical protein